MIKTIIFDFGDVFINLDKAATGRELERREMLEFSEELLKINREYEKGLLSSKEFISSFQKNYSHLTASDITTAWNAILLDFPKHRLEFIRTLASEKNYQLILLSNTNEIHIDWVRENVPFFEEFRNYFDAFYLSQEINMRKPEPSIFTYVLERHDLDPRETLFIDDTKENTEAASDLGIHTWNLDPVKDDVVDLFRIKKDLF